MKEIDVTSTEKAVDSQHTSREFRRITRDSAKPRSDRGRSEEMHEAACSLYEKQVEAGGS